MKKRVYADNAATTRLSRPALDAMMPYLTSEYGNPSALHTMGREAKLALERARNQTASVLGAVPEEIYFTSGGTEADNWAVKAAAELGKNKGRHIISTQIEHHAILNPLLCLEAQGFEVTYLGVDAQGRISLKALRDAIRKDTILISVMAANNEIGTIQPIAKIGKLAKEHKILFHVDAVQAIGHIPLDIQSAGIDMLSLAAHKFGGPKGAGALYVRKGISLPSQIQGGGQERNLRSGTENVAGIVGMAAALEYRNARMGSHMEKVLLLRNRLIEGLLRIPNARLTGDLLNRLPGIASFLFEGVEGESMVMMLDLHGICASSGSACASNGHESSHVLKAIGIPRQLSHSSLRLSLNEDNTDEDVDHILEVLPSVVARLRAMSPVWNGSRENY